MNYLITGATGNIGARIVNKLIALGHRPRVLARSDAKARALFGERVDIVCGDLDDERALCGACTGVDVMFLLNSGPHIARLDGLGARVAKATGVRRIVKLSAMGARAKSSTAELGSWHAAGEAAIRTSGIAWTFVQPAGFMTNALGWASAIKREGVLRASTGDGRIAMIHPDDIASVAARALASEDYVEHLLPITGPQALTYADMAAALSAAIGRRVAFQCVGDEEARKMMMLEHGLPEPVANALVSLWQSVREGRVAGVTDTVELVLGRKPLTFARWAEENAAAFR
jgi:uncharacterized protein YbjT (DUF2867 family)